MSTLEADLSFDFTFFEDPVVASSYGYGAPYESYETYEPLVYHPTTPPSFAFDPSLLELAYDSNDSSHCASSGHGRAGSHSSSTYSAAPSVESSPGSWCSRMTTPPPPPPQLPSAYATPPPCLPCPPCPPPPHYSPPVRQHGPILLPKIRPQDQAIEAPLPAPGRAARTATPPAPASSNGKKTAVTKASSAFRPAHARSFTNPEALSYSPGLCFSQLPEGNMSASAALTVSPASYAPDGTGAYYNSLVHHNHHTHHHHNNNAASASVVGRRASSVGIDTAASSSPFPTFAQMPPSSSYLSTPRATPATDAFMFPSSYTNGPAAAVPASRASPAPAAVPQPPAVPQTNMAAYLTGPNPAPSLVRSISFPLRDPHAKHFWWDVRQVRPWTGFTREAILGLPGASALLGCPVPAQALAAPAPISRHPETEPSLHQLYATHYMTKLNAALAISSTRPLQLSIPARTAVGGRSATSVNDLLFVATVAGEPATAAAIFGGRPSARVVGMVRSFHRFNTGMRVEGNIKRVEYLRGLAAIHHAMREHGCRYGFILTEIELVVVRNGVEPMPFFGHLEVAIVPLADAAAATAAPATAAAAAAAASDDGSAAAAALPDPATIPLTACLALWGLCMMAGPDDRPAPGQAHWRSEIGAPAEHTRTKAMPRDSWMPQPQLAEKREAKRSRGWVFPEDPVGRKEIGRRGVRYGGC